MEIAILVLHILAAMGIVGLVLIQHGKGADVGAAFGSGASGSLFGASGSANFLSRATAVLAVVFFMTSLGLTYFHARKGDSGGGVMSQPLPEQSLPGQIPGQAPVAPKPGAAVPAPAAPEGGRAQEVPK